MQLKIHAQTVLSNIIILIINWTFLKTNVSYRASNYKHSTKWSHNATKIFPMCLRVTVYAATVGNENTIKQKKKKEENLVP